MKKLLLLLVLFTGIQSFGQTDSIEKYGNGMYFGHSNFAEPKQTTDTVKVFIMVADTANMIYMMSLGNKYRKSVSTVYCIKGLKIYHFTNNVWLYRSEYLTEDKKTLKNLIIINSIRR